MWLCLGHAKSIRKQKPFFIPLSSGERVMEVVLAWGGSCVGGCEYFLD